MQDHSEPTRTSKARAIATFVVTVALALSAFEFVLRTWLVSPRYKVVDSELGLLNRPNARVVWSEEGWGSHRTNSLGLISPPLRDDADVRVLLLGNSYTESLNVSREESFAGVAESTLRGHELVNAAHSGWSMVHELALLRRLAPVLRPDVVVAQFSSASLFDRTAVHLREDDSGGWTVIASPEDLSATRRLKDATDPLAESSALFTMVLRNSNTLRRGQAERLAHKFGAAPPQTVQDVNAAKLIEPREAIATEWLLREMAELAPHIVVLVIPSVTYAADGCERPAAVRNAMIHRVAATVGVTIVDPTAAFCESYLRTRQPLHGFHNSVMGEGHLNARGHQVLAVHLADAIANLRR